MDLDAAGDGGHHDNDKDDDDNDNCDKYDNKGVDSSKTIPL